jgi:hypothetical protein
MTDAEALEEQGFAEEETPTVIADRRHVPTWRPPASDRAAAPGAETASTEPAPNGGPSDQAGS